MSLPVFWESNLRPLGIHHSEFLPLESLPERPPEIKEGVDFIHTSSGHWTALLRTRKGQSIPLHDIQDPRAEARGEVEKQWEGWAKASCILILGMGLSYLALATAERLSPGQLLILIVGEPLLFWKSLEKRHR